MIEPETASNDAYSSVNYYAAVRLVGRTNYLYVPNSVTGRSQSDKSPQYPFREQQRIIDSYFLGYTLFAF